LGGSSRLQLWDLVPFGNLARAQIEGGKTVQPGCERLIGDSLGMQLIFDVLSEAKLADAFDVARSRSKANPVEHVDDCLIVVGRCGSASQSAQDAERGDQRSGGKNDGFRAVHTSLRQTRPRKR